jgi:hypothetical protein
VPHYWRPRRGQQVTNRSSPRHVPGCYVKISLIKDIFSREGLATAGQGHFTHATHSPARWGICPHARSFLGFVQFSVPAFQHPLFSRKSQDPKFRHFAHMPEVPTATSDLTFFWKALLLIRITQNGRRPAPIGAHRNWTYFRPYWRHPQTPPDPGNDGAQARPFISATPGFLCAPLN